jgi:hypothetical protein
MSGPKVFHVVTREELVALQDTVAIVEGAQ